MEDQHHQGESTNTTSSSSNPNTRTTTITTRDRATSSGGEPVRSRWTPKPEQILILESIFNSGMVNPPKEETIRIRKLLEKFGSVGDANVFYWFQNRRSRSRRRQRQLQASLSVAAPPAVPVVGGYECGAAGVADTTACFGGYGGVEGVFGNLSGQMGVNVVSSHHHLESNSCGSSSILGNSDAPNLDFSSGSGGIITVFINGVATQVTEGPLDVKSMFGEEVVLVHSSGVPVPFNEFGISFQSLQHGESYYLVPRLN